MNRTVGPVAAPPVIRARYASEVATKRTKRRSVPRFASLDEEREWFEAHADDVEGTELQENPFAAGRTTKIAYSLRLDADDVDRLEAEAARRGVRPTQLARELILAGLNEGDDNTDPSALAKQLRQMANRLSALPGRAPRTASKGGRSSRDTPPKRHRVQ